MGKRRLTTSTFSCDIARSVSRGRVGRVGSRKAGDRKTAGSRRYTRPECPRRTPGGARDAPETTVDHVRAIRASLPAHFEFDERDLALLELAEQQAADVDALLADVRARGVRNDDDRLNSAVREARQARIALARILGQVDMPEAGTGAQIHGRRAAHARWAEAS